MISGAAAVAIALRPSPIVVEPFLDERWNSGSRDAFCIRRKPIAFGCKSGGVVSVALSPDAAATLYGGLGWVCPGH